jgi:diacylglycerol kinase family enzyme
MSVTTTSGLWTAALAHERHPRGPAAGDPGGGQTRAAVAAGVDVVIAAGGDGTVRACVEHLVGTRVALAILPFGTGNLLAANLGVPPGMRDALAVVTSGRRRLLRRRPTPPLLELIRASRIQVTTTGAHLCELDGEVLSPASTLTAMVRPAALWVVAPPSANPDPVSSRPDRRAAGPAAAPR